MRWFHLRANNRSHCLFRHEHRRRCFPHDLFLSGIAPLARSCRPVLGLYCAGARKLNRVFWWTGLPHDWLRLFGVAPIAIGIKKLFAKRDAHVKRARTGTLDVATVTFVNGADNIGIYTPLFALSDAPRVAVLVAVLYVLLAAWCVAGYLIHRQKAVAYTLQRWGHWIVPVVLIALGIYILLN